MIFGKTKKSRFSVRQRITLVYGVLGALMFGLCARVFDLSVSHHAEYRELADQRSTHHEGLPHERGRIFSSDGQILAQTNLTSGNSVFMNVRQVPREDLPAVATRLAGTLNIDADDLLAKLKRHSRNAGLPIKHFLADEEARNTKKLVDAGMLPGTHFRPRMERVYPKGQLASHLVGFVNLDGIGSGGIELSYDRQLKGKDGQVAHRVDARRRGIHDEGTELSDPTDGNDVHLTLDSTIQEFAEEALRDLHEDWAPHTCTAIVMESKTGRILAMANLPTFDPNFYFSAEAEARNNVALTNGWEPGSIFKPLILAAAIEKGVIDPDKPIPYKPNVYIGGRRKPISDGSHPVRAKDQVDANGNPTEGGGYVTPRMGIVKSSNTVACYVAQSLFAGRAYPDMDFTDTSWVLPFDMENTNGRLDEQLRAFGFGSRTGIDIGGGGAESPGILPTKNGWFPENKKTWDRKIRYAKSFPVASMAMGLQVQVSSMQMLAAFNAISIDGKRMRPYVVEKIVDREGNIVKEQKPEVAGHSGFSESTARLMRDILKDVVSGEGTARRALDELGNYTMAGKTGTAHIVLPGETQYSKHKTCSFVGFAPADDPRLTIIVTSRYQTKAPVNKYGNKIKSAGGSVAAPAVAKIMKRSLKYLGVQEDKSAVNDGDG